MGKKQEFENEKTVYFVSDLIEFGRPTRAKVQSFLMLCSECNGKGCGMCDRGYQEIIDAQI